jgi:hypothetical protein
MIRCLYISRDGEGKHSKNMKETLITINGSKSPRGGKQVEWMLDTEMESEEDQQHIMEPPHPPRGLPPKVIFETHLT